jgi:hypothetical protein
MATLTWTCLVPSLVAMAAAWAWARRAGDREFLLAARAGFVGGLWGTLGYDWVRVPLHAMGQNPFAPIRAYGLWIAAAAQSTPLTDLLGLLYHFSNGLTFGWIYAIVALRRHWLWGIVWALALEALAVVSPFGSVFAIRYAPGALAAAFAAHLFYGAPLGWICRRLAVRPDIPVERRWLGALTALFVAWFLVAWGSFGDLPPTGAGQIVLGPDRIRPGWRSETAGGTLRLVNRTREPLTVRYRHSSESRTPGHAIVLPPLGRDSLRIERSGIYQVLAPGRPWRSVFVSARAR